MSEYSAKDVDEAYEIGKRDGYSDAVQEIDQLTGGDGEYRYCTDHDPERHTPGPAEMIQRIVDRFEILNLLEDASKSGRDKPDDFSVTERFKCLYVERKEDGGIIRLSRWPEGFILWFNGQIVWKSWKVEPIEFPKDAG